MGDVKKDHKVIIDNKEDNQKLIHLYLEILGIKDYSKYTYQELVDIFDHHFGTKFTIKDIRLYFEPNMEEEIEDLMLQLKNLNL